MPRSSPCADSCPRYPGWARARSSIRPDPGIAVTAGSSGTREDNRGVRRWGSGDQGVHMDSVDEQFCNTGEVDFTSAYAHGFARIAACTVPVKIADPATNAATVIEQARQCHDDGVAVAIFPELCLTGYSIDDLFLQDTLLEAVQAAIAQVVEASQELRPVLVVGAPLRKGNRVYN